MLTTDMANRREIELLRARHGYLIMEVMVSLGIVAMASTAFLGIYFHAKQLHRHLSQKAGALLVLQSVVDDVRMDRLPTPLGAIPWNSQGEQRRVWPVEPSTNGVSHGGYRWQLETPSGPSTNGLMTVTAVVQWTEHNDTRRVSLTTQVYRP